MHTKVITIRKVNPSLFIFVRSHSGTEMLNPRRKLCKKEIGLGERLDLKYIDMADEPDIES
jgi:hypothetical protein